MQQRIDNLEGLVKRLIYQQQINSQNEGIYTQNVPEPGVRSALPLLDSDALDVAGSPESTVIDGVHSIYKGAAGNWYDVLQEVGVCFLLLFLSTLPLSRSTTNLTNHNLDKPTEKGLEPYSRRRC